ncbi:hypothetical protein K9L63_01250 [Candidatus Gracilibacteria bacterium]|nr:hypothetical protein [Candidatus Gracilibacteria bacterium]
MKIENKQKIFWGVLTVAVVLSACVFPGKEDPFSKVSEEKVETIKGDLFPFSVSVATRVTHRLEDEGKLVAFLASDIVRLDDFEGRRVEVDGVRRKEKMREIFWVSAIRLLDLGKQTEEAPIDERYTTRNFSFVYPPTWESSVSPTGVVHFLDKADPARRVFLTFSAEELERGDKTKDPNVLIANLAGTKKITTDELERERQEIVLFSNIYDRKYKFIFTSAFEEFEKKKSFFKLLNSFVEGEENVLKAKEEDLKKMAEREAKKIQEEEEKKVVEEKLKEPKSESILEKLFGDDEREEEEKNATEEEEPAEQVVSTPESTETVPETVGEDTSPFIASSTDYVNLIDERAFLYESQYYGFRMWVPFGYWFRNFGASENAIARIGFSDEEFSNAAEAKFWLEILGDENPPRTFTEKMNDTRVEIEFPRTEKSFFRFTGLKKFKDAMRSIQATVEKF